jgi:hypothetical protein
MIGAASSEPASTAAAGPASWPLLALFPLLTLGTFVSLGAFSAFGTLIALATDGTSLAVSADSAFGSDLAGHSGQAIGTVIARCAAWATKSLLTARAWVTLLAV